MLDLCVRTGAHTHSQIQHVPSNSLSSYCFSEKLGCHLHQNVVRSRHQIRRLILAISFLLLLSFFCCSERFADGFITSKQLQRHLRGLLLFFLPSASRQQQKGHGGSGSLADESEEQRDASEVDGQNE